MRWKLLKRRLSISAPHMSVRSHLPWPVRWAAIALIFGFSAALALWAFELGKDLTGVEREVVAEIASLRAEVEQLRIERDKAQSIANTAESLLRTEQVTLERLGQQVRQVEDDNQALKADLGFFERLLPTSGEGVSVRGMQAELKAPGQLRFQLLVMHNVKGGAEFSGRYDVVLTGTLDGRPWTLAAPEASRPLRVKQYVRLEGLIDHPPSAVVKTVQVKVSDVNGALRATQTVKL